MAVPAALSALLPPPADRRSPRAVLAHLMKLYAVHRGPISGLVFACFLVAVATRVRHAVAEQKVASARKAAEKGNMKNNTDGGDSDRSLHKSAAAAAVTADPAVTAVPGRPPKRKKVELDGEFFRALLRLLRIVVPGWRSKEARLLLSHSFFLVVRTLISLRVAAMDGAIVKSLIKGNGREFLKRIVWWMLIAVPATFTNSMLSYHQAELSLKYRTRLTQHLHDKYLSQLTFYGISALDDRIKNPDQLIAVDVAKFSNSLAELYSNLAKPVLDMTIYTYSLSRSVGAEGVVFMSLLVQLSAAVMRALTPPFGRYVADEARLEGEFRFQHSRLIDHAEEVALCGGHAVEKDTLDKGYFTLIRHVNHILRRRFYHGFMEDFVIKYFWGALGLLLCSAPVFVRLPGGDGIGGIGGNGIEGAGAGAGGAGGGGGGGRSAAAAASAGVAAMLAHDSMGDRTETFVTNRRMLLSASDAFGRIMFSYREIMELAGYTSRVSGLLDVMDDIKAGRFEKELVSASGTQDNESVLRGRGAVVESDDIEFVDVPIVSPNGDVLVRALSFSLRHGDHLLVVGPNGCGKSSLFRILGGLWPVYGGTVRRPSSAGAIFYLPQRPYLPRGSLRQQVIYPDSTRAMRARGVDDHHLAAILRILGLSHLATMHPGGWDAEAEWRDVLSGGVQQRIAMARLFYHRPRYAILDECTSSVTLETEKVMYDHAKALGVTLMTVSHRRSLWRYHTHILQFDGQGGYLFSRLDPERRLRLEDEKEELDVLLRQVPEMERRMAELTGS